MRSESMKSLALAAVAFSFTAAFSAPLLAQESFKYQQPPKSIMDVVTAPRPPRVSFNSTHDFMLLVDAVPNPDISDSARPMLRIAGIRIDPETNGLHTPATVKNIRLERVADGAVTSVAVPATLTRLGQPVWSPDGKHFAFTNTASSGISLWVGDVAAATGSATVHRIEGVRVDGVNGAGFEWMPGTPSTRLLVQAVSPLRGKTPVEPAVAAGPLVQESDGRPQPEATYEDLLKTPYDADLYQYYATAQLERVNIATGATAPVGKPAIFASTNLSPDGQYMIVATIHRPFSYLVPDTNFPHKTEIWDMTGKSLMTISDTGAGANADTNGDDQAARGGRGGGRGPRGYAWQPLQPETLMYQESLAPAGAARGGNGGGNAAGGANPNQLTPATPAGGQNNAGRGGRGQQYQYGDKVMYLKAPFTAGTAVEYMHTEHPIASLSWGKNGDLAIVTESTAMNSQEAYFFQPNNPAALRLAWSRKNTQDRYTDPGSPMGAGGGGRGGGGRGGRSGGSVFLEDGKNIYLQGTGSSPDGDHPFVDSFNTETLKSTRLYQSPAGSYDIVSALYKPDASQLIIQHESPADPPNYYIHDTASPVADHGRALTRYTDPVPQVRQIRKKFVTYKRPSDGAELNMTVYFPPDYKEGTKAPAILWAYPAEFDNADVASEVSGSPDRFTIMTGYSELYLALDGYVILDNATMPIISKDNNRADANDTYVEQLVEDATAAVNEAARLGYIDPNRVGVAGHSYGAFMTANLLAHSNLFKAGNAQSGAYNRSLTPFGFQNERRTYWDDNTLYQNMSPFNYADKIKAPILLIHGMADSNSGTFPIQSERMYTAIEGNGGTVRFVYLPYEPHGYAAQQTIEDVLYEMDTWFNKYVKNLEPVHTPPPRGRGRGGN